VTQPSTGHAERAAVSRTIPQAAALAGLGSILTNTLIYLLGTALGHMTITLADVLIFSLIGVVGGAGLFVLLRRVSRHPNRLMLIIGVAVLVLYAAGPIAAAQAPYMEGAERFTLTTVIATELMHLSSGAWVLGLFTRWIPQTSASERASSVPMPDQHVGS